MVGVNLHNFLIVGMLGALFILLAKLAAGTGLRKIPLLGNGIGLLASA